jgi:hypothetical protein
VEVFISWSDERSKYVARCLHTWFRQVLQMVKPWMSSESILAGQRWNAEVSQRLSQTKFGVICVTPENLDSSWLNFEAGALAKTVDDKTFVCVYLIGGLNEIDSRHPLSQFQYKLATKDGTYDVVAAMHKALLAETGAAALGEAQVQEAFEQWWPKLEARLGEIPPVPDRPKKETDTSQITEILDLTRGIAQSVSNLLPRLQAPQIIEPLSDYLAAETLQESLDRVASSRIRKALEDANGNRAEAAAMLEIDRTTLYRIIKRLGLEPAG